jgi:hypothetical protein
VLATDSYRLKSWENTDVCAVIPSGGRGVLSQFSFEAI